MTHKAAWYIQHAGRRILAATKRQAHDLAQAIADRTGKPVTVRPIAKRRSPTSSQPRRIAARRNPAGRAYWMVYTRESDGRWYPQFGDHDREDVQAERDSMRREYRASDLKLVRFGSVPSQAGAMAKARELNADFSRAIAARRNPVHVEDIAAHYWRLIAARKAKPAARRPAGLGRKSPWRLEVIDRHGRRQVIKQATRAKADDLAGAYRAAGYRAEVMRNNPAKPPAGQGRHGYNAAAVSKAIASSRKPISKREAALIHALLRGRG